MLRKVHMFDFNVQNGDKNLKFIDPNWSEEIFVIRKIEDFVSYTYVIGEFNGWNVIWRIVKNI